MNKKVMYDLSYGLYVLTAREGEKDNGCIINTALQVTTTPNRISIAVNKDNYTCGMVERTGVFNVSIIDERAGFDIFERFGFHSGRDTDKTAGIDIGRSQNGVVFVPQNTAGYISCKVVEKVDMGSHMVFFAEVTDGDKLSDAAPMTYAFYHKNVKPAPEKTAKKGFRCKICGYVYEGDELPADFVCPICKHGADDFERI